MNDEMIRETVLNDIRMKKAWSSIENRDHINRAIWMTMQLTKSMENERLRKGFQDGKLVIRFTKTGVVFEEMMK